MNKEHLLRLLANDDLDALIQGLLDYARKFDLPELRADTIIQSGLLEAYKKASRAGLNSMEESGRQRALVRHALLEITNELPETPPVLSKSKRKKGLSEAFFKQLLFWSMVFGKAMVILWLLFQGDTGGFSSKEVGVTITMLLPVFTAYLTPMVAEFLENRHIHTSDSDKMESRLSWTLPAITFLLILPIYFGTMVYFIGLRGQGSAQLGDFNQALQESKNLFEQMTANIMFLESAIGIYIGMIINTLFNKNA